MNNSEADVKSDSGLYKIISAILIAILLILIVGFAVFGLNGSEGENSGEIDDNSQINADKPNGDTNGNGGTADNISDPDDEVSVNPMPALTYYLTGLTCGEDKYRKIPYVFVTEPRAPLYGISNAELVVEMPTEGGQTRFMMFMSSIGDAGKLGAFAPTRDYMSAMVKFFGGILVANGNDDIVRYNTLAQSLHLDLSENSSFYYKENGKNVYSDNDKIETMTSKAGIDTESLVIKQLPFVFADPNATVRGNSIAQSIVIPYAADLTTKHIYNESTGVYTMYKGDRASIDMLTGKGAEFNNVFVLFSDVVTYELAEGTESVVNTATNGTGYYLTRGTLTEIRWHVDEQGALHFTDLNGDVLEVNRGTSYIGYYKAALSDAVTYGSNV